MSKTTGSFDSNFAYNRGPFFDWLAFSIPVTNDWIFWATNKFGPLRENPHGFSGYPVSATSAAGALIAWHPAKPEQKIHVVLSSRALANVAADYGETIGSIIESALKRDAVFTRVDIALDDYGLTWSGDEATSRSVYLTPERVFRHLRRGYVVSKFRGFQKIDAHARAVEGEQNPDTGEEMFSYYARLQTGKIGKSLGETVYIGSPSSDVRCRVYDKAAQTGLPMLWNRFEIVFRRKRAQAIIEQLNKINIPGLILYYVDFKESRGSARVSRRPSAAWWLAFLETAEKEKLNLPKQTPGLEEIDAWVHRQVSGALWLLYEAYGWDKIDEIMQDGKQKFERNARYQNLLQR